MTFQKMRANVLETMKPREQVKRRKRQSDAIVIGSRGDLPNAEILRNVNGDQMLSGLGHNFMIRRVQRRQLLLQLHKT